MYTLDKIDRSDFTRGGAIYVLDANEFIVNNTNFE